MAGKVVKGKHEHNGTVVCIGKERGYLYKALMVYGCMLLVERLCGGVLSANKNLHDFFMKQVL